MNVVGGEKDKRRSTFSPNALGTCRLGLTFTAGHQRIQITKGYKGHVRCFLKLAKSTNIFPFQPSILLNAMASFYVLAIFSVCLHPITASLIFTGQTLFLNNIPYYVPATPLVTLPSFSFLTNLGSADGLVPVTVVALPSSNFSLSTVEAVVSGFGADDVWNEGFLEGMYSDNSPLVLNKLFVRSSMHLIEDIANICQAFSVLPLSECAGLSHD